MMRLLTAFSISILLCSVSALAAPRQPLRGPYGPNIKYHSPTRPQNVPTGTYYAPNGPVAGGVKQGKNPAATRSLLDQRRREYPDRFSRNGTVLPPNGGSSIGSTPFPGGTPGSGGNFNPSAGTIRPGAGREETEDQGEYLEEALEAIEKAWKTGDGKSLQERFPIDRKIGIFQRGQYSGESPGRELSLQVAEGAAALKTISIKLDPAKGVEADRRFVTGPHVFIAAEQRRQTVYVSYSLERIKGRWMVTEYGWSDRPVTKHKGLPAREEAFGPGS